MTEREWKAVDSLAKDEWERFKHRITSECRELQRLESAQFEYQDTNGSLTIRRSAFKTLRLEFDAAVPRIIWECESASKVKGWVTFRLHEGVLRYMSEGQPLDVDDLVDSLMVCLRG